MHPERRPNTDRSPEALEARLLALPQPAVPADLEARLLAGIPVETLFPRRRWVVRVGVIGALAAACLLAVLAWRWRDGKDKFPAPHSNESAHKETPRPPDDSDGTAPLREYHRVLDGGDMPAFTWPLAETSPLTVLTSIPPDLLD
jgi:hypothetical protein